MNAKEVRKYNLLNGIMSAQPQQEQVVAMLSELAAIDFTTAMEVWEYVLMQWQNELATPSTSRNAVNSVFDMLIETSETKFRQLFLESLPINKYVYSFAPTAAQGKNLQFIASLIMSPKLDAAAEILRCLKANDYLDFSEVMKDILDAVFAAYCQKNNVIKPELSRKQSALLLEYIDKTKGPNKKLLTQRIKEL